MIDVHTHILWGLDDGARDLNESLAMVEMAYECGTTDIVATPHANRVYAYDSELIEKRVQELQARSGPKIRIHRGCDFHLQSDNVLNALENPSKYAINGNNYLLVEFSDMMGAAGVGVLHRLRSAGLTPIITHPERNPVLRQSPETLEQLVRQGYYVQVTAQSLLGRFGIEAHQFATNLIRHGNVDLIASDSHDLQNRPPRLDQAYEYVAQEFGENLARDLFVQNPACVLTGTAIQRRTSRIYKRKWYQRWA